MTRNQVVKTWTQMQKCIQTGRTIDAKSDCVEIGVSGKIAKTVRCLMIREQGEGILVTEHVALECRGDGEWQTESHPGAVQALNCQCMPSRDLGLEHLLVYGLCSPSARVA
jgi:hypothetical protein